MEEDKPNLCEQNYFTTMIILPEGGISFLKPMAEEAKNDVMTLRHSWFPLMM